MGGDAGDHDALLQLQFSRILDGHDALVIADEGGECVQHRGLTGTGAAGDDEVRTGLDGRFEEHVHRLAHGTALQQVLSG